MLQSLRNKAQSPVIQGIVLIIAVVFVFWGVGTNMKSRESALVVNDEEISFQRYQEVYNQTVNIYKEQFNGSIPKGFLDLINIKQQVINKLIQESLLRQGAADMGIRVSREEVQDKIQNMPEFSDNGTFSMDRYKAILASNKYSPNKFEASIRFDMLAQKTIDSIIAFGSTITDYEINDLYKLEKESISLQFVHLTPDSFSDKITPTEEELKTFFEESKENYKTEPRIKMQYILFDYQDIASQMTIDEDVAKEQYQKDINLYNTPETRHARHILFTADQKATPEVLEEKRKKAEEILELARNGNDFSKLASEYSEGPSKTNGGDLGQTTRGQMVKPFEDAVFSMKAGEISDVVKTKYGFHIIKLEKITPARTKSFAEVKDSIVQTMLMTQAKSSVSGKANSAYNGIISAGSLPAYAQAHPEIEVRETAFFSHTNPPDELTKYQTLMNNAFKLKKGELSSLLEIPTGYGILFVTDYQEPSLPELEDVKAEVTENFKKQKALEQARLAAEKMLSALKEGANFKEEAAALDLEIQTTGPITKNEKDPTSSFPPSLLAESFGLSQQSPYPDQPGLVGTDYYLFKFLERHVPETKPDDTERKRYHDNLVKMTQEKVLSAWLKMLQQDAKIYTSKKI